MTTSAFIQARIGKLTASRMNDALDFLKSGKPSAARTKYMHDIVAERLTDIVTQHYVTPEMQHGLDFEAQAKQEYTQRTGNHVRQCGTFDHFDIDNLAATPDGLVGHDGLIEVKCATTPKHISWCMAGVPPDEHKNQMITQLMCTGREWVDFVAFDPRIKGSKRLMIVRFTPTDEELEAVRIGAIQFLNEVESLFEFMSTETA